MSVWAPEVKHGLLGMQSWSPLGLPAEVFEVKGGFVRFAQPATLITIPVGQTDVHCHVL